MINVPVLVKDALREGNKRKNYRIVVYQADGETVDFTIDNDNLVSESVAFDERMCSDTNLKFGLCEGTSVEFQYFGYGNITGRRIQVFLDVQYTDTDHTDKWHSIPMGWFTVDETSRQASTGIRKVSAYNKLKSEYLNQSANAEIVSLAEQGEDGTNVISFYKIIQSLLESYSIEEYKKIDAEVSYLSNATQYGYSIEAWINGSLKYINVVGGSTGISFSGSSPDYEKYGIIEVNNTGMDDYSSNLLINYRNALVFLRDRSQVTLEYAVKNHLQIAVIDYRTSSSLVYKDISSMVLGSVSISNDISGYIWDFDENVVSDSHLFKNEMISFAFPYYWQVENSAYDRSSVAPTFSSFLLNTFIPDKGWTVRAYRLDVPELAYKSITFDDAVSMANVTLRDIQSSVYETICQYGKLDRVTDLFSGVELNNSRLYPADNLYPANDLYPNSTSERSDPTMYEKLWADEGNVRSFRYLIITYKGTEDDGQGNLQEVEKKLQRTVDEHGTDDYNMSDNWLFRNLVWSDSDIGDYADAMVLKMQNVTWFPFEMWCAGLPYIETGDEVEINMSDGAYTSYVLRRNLKGIQDLHDEMINGTLDIF